MIDGYLHSTQKQMVFDYLMGDTIEIAKAIDNWVILTDGITDHEIGPETAMKAAEWGLKVVEYCAGRVSLWHRVSEPLNLLCIGGTVDVEYVAGKMDIESDLELWKLKANRLSVQFALVCHDNPHLDTEENWSWVKQTQESMLKLNDCLDLLSGSFEDLIQIRRNWVLLNHFDSNIFVGWKEKDFEIREAAMSELIQIQISNPPCDSLRVAFGLFAGVVECAQRRYL